jgi:lysophospholipase L1-like esterase
MKMLPPVPKSIPKEILPIDPLRIAGFGACMITGYPHQRAGLFEVTCRLVEERLSRPVLSTVVSLGGFPAPRAQKYLKKKLFGFNPQYIVIQFGATDAQCPIRAGSRPTDHGSSLNTNHISSLGAAAQNSASYHAQPASALSPLRWKLASAIGYLRRIEPITPLASYVAAIERMVDECRTEGITPVVLSPFAYGSRYTAKTALRYVKALEQLNLKKQPMIFVDCFSLLTAFPKTKILQHDGFHLSPLGHRLVGEAIGEAIVEDCEGGAIEKGSADHPMLAFIPSQHLEPQTARQRNPSRFN